MSCSEKFETNKLTCIAETEQLSASSSVSSVSNENVIEPLAYNYENDKLNSMLYQPFLADILPELKLKTYSF